MSIITLIVVLAVVGFLLWAVNQYVPMPAGYKQVLNVVVILLVVVWIASLFLGGVNLPAIR